MRITLLGLSLGLTWGGIHGLLSDHIFRAEGAVCWAIGYGALLRLAFHALGWWQRQLAGVALGWLLAMGYLWLNGLDGISHALLLGLAAVGWSMTSGFLDPQVVGSFWKPTFKNFERLLSRFRGDAESSGLD